MGLKETLVAGFNRLNTLAGTEVRIARYSKTTGSVYDDDLSLTLVAGSTVWLSGIVLPLKASSDHLLVEQGLIKPDDMKLFISGGIDLSNTPLPLKIQLGSPTGDNFTIIEPGVNAPQVRGTKIFKKAYIRRLTNGSLIGES